MRKISAALITLLCVGFIACENSDQLGLEVTPPGERFAYRIDSLSGVSMTTLLQDSLTAERRNPVLVGSINDPVFGAKSGGLMTQLRLSSSNVDFGENIQVDSAVLLLKYHDYLGDTTTMQQINVFELTQGLEYDSTYYSNIDKENYYNEGSLVASMAFTPTPSADSLLIRLDDAVGYKILEADTLNLSDNASFLEYFKGLYIQTESVTSGGAMTYFNLSGGKSRLTLYYSNAEEDSLSYDVVINDKCTWVSTFDHDYSGSEAGAVVNDSIDSHDLVFLEAMSGLRGGIQIHFSDSILKWADEGIAINKAELIFPVAESYVTENRPKPTSLAVFGANEDGTNAFIDDIFLGESYYDGTYHSNKGAYVFNIARHVQNLLNPDFDKRKENNGLFVVVNNARVSAGAVVVRNGDLLNGTRLRITYTLIN